MNALKILSTIIGAIAPLMYFHGQAFHWGWLKYWSLPDGLFPLTLEEALIQGYIAYTVLAIPYLLLLFLYLLLALGMLYNIHEISKFSWARRVSSIFTAQKERNTVPGHPVIASALSRILKATMLSLFVLLFLFLITKVTEKVSTLGEESAARKHVHLLNGDTITEFGAAGQIMKGNIVICSNSFCAVLSEGRVFLTPLDGKFGASWNAPNK